MSQKKVSAIKGWPADKVERRQVASLVPYAFMPGGPKSFPHCVGIMTHHAAANRLKLCVLPELGTRRQWRVPFEKRRPSQVAVGNARSRQALMKIVLVVAGPLFVALELFWFGQAAGLHNAVLIDVVAGVAALGIGLGWFALR